MNVQDIITLTREYIDEEEEDSSDWSDLNLLSYINVEHRHLGSITRQSYEDYLGREYVFVLDETKLNYFLPFELATVRRVEIVKGGVTGTFPNLEVDELTADIIELDEIPLNQKEAATNIYRSGRRLAMEGFYLWQSQIRFTRGTPLQGRYCRIFHNPNIPDLHYGVATGGGSDFITLAAAAQTTLGTVKNRPNYYQNMLVEIVSGTGAGQLNLISRYDGATKKAYVANNWTTTPTVASTYSIISPIQEDYQELLALGAAMRAKGLKTEDDTSAIVAIYGTLMDDYRKAIESRVSGRSRRVVRRRL